ncbi:MAG: hypothetical protein IPK24_05680 [Kineosporiaceae bacterium]|nr:hypothetical protein [Kineosporiaceae bacterium]
MLATVMHVALWVLAGIGALTVALMAAIPWIDSGEPKATARKSLAEMDRDELERAEFEGMLRQLRELEAEAEQRLRSLRGGR